MNSSRPTYLQLEVLVDFLERNPGIAKGVMRSAHGKHDTKKKWEEVAISINALGGAHKDGKGWAKYWSDKKCALKKTCSQQGQSMRRTGGGPADELPSLTPIDQRLVAILGGPQFASGDSHVAVNPFPTSQVIELEEVASTSPRPVTETARVNTPSPPTRERSPLLNHSARRQHSRTGRTLLDRDRAVFAAIEAQRVEAETLTARALTHAVESLDGLSAAIRDGSRMIADALDRIAASLRHN